MSTDMVYISPTGDSRAKGAIGGFYLEGWYYYCMSGKYIGSVIVDNSFFSKKLYNCCLYHYYCYKVNILQFVNPLEYKNFKTNYNSMLSML